MLCHVLCKPPYARGVRIFAVPLRLVWEQPPYARGVRKKEEADEKKRAKASLRARGKESKAVPGCVIGVPLRARYARGVRSVE